MGMPVRGDRPNLSERLHGAVRQLAMDSETGLLSKAVDDLIEICDEAEKGWATVVPIEMIRRVIRRDLRVWDRS